MILKNAWVVFNGVVITNEDEEEGYRSATTGASVIVTVDEKDASKLRVTNAIEPLQSVTCTGLSIRGRA